MEQRGTGCKCIVDHVRTGFLRVCTVSVAHLLKQSILITLAD